MTRRTRAAWGVLWFAVLTVAGGCDKPEAGSPGLEPPDEVDGGFGPGAEQNAGRSGSSGKGGAGGAPAMGGVSGIGAAGSAAGSGGAGAAGAAGIGDPGADGGMDVDDAGVDSPSCEPVAEMFTALERASHGETCPMPPAFDSGVPNSDGASIWDLALATPLQPGEPYAISLRPLRNSRPGSIEIWGSDSACTVDELLWYGEMNGLSQCIDLRPTRPHTRLQVVSRMLEVLQGIFTYGASEYALCPGGSCPAGSDGHALEPGVTLEPPIGVYDLVCYSWNGGQHCRVGVWGTMVLAYDQARSAERTLLFDPIAGGVLRLPAHDPYGDRWYCVGAGSHMEESEDPRYHDVHLEGVTSMPACTPGSGTASFDLTRPNGRGAITSSLPELAVADVDIEGRCALDRCFFQLVGDGASSHLSLLLDGTVSGVTAPVQLQVLEASWFTVPGTRVPMSGTCASSGVLDYDPNGTSTVQLDDLGAFVTCPDQAGETLDLVGE